MSDRRYEIAKAALQEFYNNIKAECQSAASVEGTFVHRMRTSDTMLYHAFAVLRNVLENEAEVASSSASPNVGGCGQLRIAHSGQMKIATPPTPHSDESGQMDIARSGPFVSAASSEPIRDGETKRGAPNKATQNVSPPPRTPVPPSAEKIAAQAEVKMRSAAAVLFRLHDGRDIMDVTMSELPYYRAAGDRQAVVCDRIIKHTANPQPHAHVRDVIAAATLEKFLREFSQRGRSSNAA